MDLLFSEAKMVTMTAVSNLEGRISLASVNLLMKTNIPLEKKKNKKKKFRNSVSRYIKVNGEGKPVNVKISTSLHICGIRDRTISTAEKISERVIEKLKTLQQDIDYTKNKELSFDSGDKRIKRFLEENYDQLRYTREDFLDKVRSTEHVIDFGAKITGSHSVMINYSYEIGFKINKISFANVFFKVPGTTVIYDNRQDAAVKIEIPYDVMPGRARLIRVLVNNVISRLPNAKFMSEFLLLPEFFVIKKLLLFSYTIKVIIEKILDSDKFTKIAELRAKKYAVIILTKIMAFRAFKSEKLKYSSKSKHTFMVYYTGHVNQSSPNPKLAAEAFEIFKKMINEHCVHFRF